MSMLGAFLRGAAGPGLIDLSNRLDRRDAMSAEEQRRQKEREEDRAWRSSEAQKDRDSRADSAATRTSRGGGGGGEDGGADADRYAVAELMKREGVSEGEARALIQAGRAGTNPLTTAVNDESGGHSAPDMARWAQVNRTIAQAMIEGPSKARSNYDQLTEGDGNAQRNTITSGMLAGKLTPAQTAEGVAATKGEGAYGKGNVNTFTGTPDAVGKSVIAENNAQAGSAGRANRDTPDADSLAKLPPGVKARIDLIKKRAEQINGAITKAQADGMWDTGQNPAQAGLVAELQKLDAEARDLLKPYIPKQPAPKVDPSQARREAEAAVAAGAPIDRVNARLKEMGLEPIAPPAKPAKPAEGKKGPSMIDRISMGIGDAVDTARGAMDVKAQIKARIAEAKNGGKPLTPGEKQLAEKFGIAL
jgi:hypothetical protein